MNINMTARCDTIAKLQRIVEVQGLNYGPGISPLHHGILLPDRRRLLYYFRAVSRKYRNLRYILRATG
jgi:hypothetical protein